MENGIDTNEQYDDNMFGLSITMDQNYTKRSVLSLDFSELPEVPFIGQPEEGLEALIIVTLKRNNFGRTAHEITSDEIDFVSVLDSEGDSNAVIVVADPEGRVIAARKSKGRVRRPIKSSGVSKV